MARRPFMQRVGRAWRELRGASAPRRARRSHPYAGAQGGRLFNDWVAGAMSPDDETKMSLRKLRARARELDRNNGLAHHFFDLLEIHVIGPNGFDPLPQVRDRAGKLAKATNTLIRDAWYSWASGPVSYDETMDFVALSKLLVRTAAMDGEAFVRIHRDASAQNGLGLYLEPVDADLVDETLNREARDGQNEIRMGIEVDARGRRVAYHLQDPGGYGNIVKRAVRVPASDMIHILSPRRVNQTRGVTWLAPSMYALRQEGAYTDAELVGARLGASKMGFYYRDSADEFGGVNPEAADAAAEDEQGVPEGSYKEEVEPGVFGKLPDGYKFQGFDPTHPTTAYGEFTKNIVRRIASGLSFVSYESLSNDRESTTYSSSRTGLLLERDAMKSLHAWWTFQFHRRVWWEHLSWALLTGSLKLESRSPFGYQAVKWQPRGWDWVDPTKDVQAAVLTVNNGLGSRTQYAAERGRDLEEVFEELAAEQAMAKRLGISLAPAPSLAPAAAPPEDDDDEGDEEKPGTKPRALVKAALNGHGSAHANGAGR